MNATYKYRVRAECLACGRVWMTRPKPNKDAPHRCHKKQNGEGCGSTRVEKNQLYIRSNSPDEPDWIKVEEE